MTVVVARSYSRNSCSTSDEIETGRSGSAFAQLLRGLPLVDRVGERVEEADGQHVDAGVAQPVAAATSASRSSGVSTAPARVDPLGHLERVLDGRDRVGLLVDHPAEQRPGRPRAGEVQQVAEALRDQQADAGAGAREDGVGGDGRPVQDGRDVGRRAAGDAADLVDAVQHALGLVGRRRRHLRQVHGAARLVVEQEVGERPADVDPEPQHQVDPTGTKGPARCTSPGRSRPRTPPSHSATPSSASRSTPVSTPMPSSM